MADTAPGAEWIVAGATLRGPAHRRARLPNQDAWLGRAWQQGGLLTVADGLGSRPLAHLGSRAACRAVSTASTRWFRSGSPSVELLLRAIHIDWRLYIHPHPPTDCATTCLFAAARSGQLVLGQLGDGLVAALFSDGRLVRLEQTERDFSNETTGLGITSSLGEWHIMELPSEGLQAVVLATDGVSEELDPANTDGVLRWLQEELPAIPKRSRSRWLSTELRGLDAPGRIDDRTLAAMITPRDPELAS